MAAPPARSVTRVSSARVAPLEACVITGWERLPMASFSRHHAPRATASAITSVRKAGWRLTTMYCVATVTRGLTEWSGQCVDCPGYDPGFIILVLFVSWMYITFVHFTCQTEEDSAALKIFLYEPAVALFFWQVSLTHVFVGFLLLFRYFIATVRTCGRSLFWQVSLTHIFVGFLLLCRPASSWALTTTGLRSWPCWTSKSTSQQACTAWDP